jgi:predicted RNA-binding protein YlxR (DUF448 family)
LLSSYTKVGDSWKLQTNAHQKKRRPASQKGNSVRTKEQRRRNVVMFGVPAETDLDEIVENVVLKKLPSKERPKEEIIEKAYRFGRDSPQRPILIRFKNLSDKERTMELASNLKGKKIYISDDLTIEEQQNRRKTVNAHKAAVVKNIESKMLRQG